MHALLTLTAAAAALINPPIIHRPSTVVPPRTSAANCRLTLGTILPGLAGRAAWTNTEANAEAGLTHVLSHLVRKTAAHTVTGRGRDWRGVFARLSPDGALLGPEELRMAVSELAGPDAVGGDGDLEAIVQRYDRTGNGFLS